MNATGSTAQLPCATIQNFSRKSKVKANFKLKSKDKGDFMLKSRVKLKYYP